MRNYSGVFAGVSAQTRHPVRHGPTSSGLRPSAIVVGRQTFARNHRITSGRLRLGHTRLALKPFALRHSGPDEATTDPCIHRSFRFRADVSQFLQGVAGFAATSSNFWPEGEANPTPLKKSAIELGGKALQNPRDFWRPGKRPNGRHSEGPIPLDSQVFRPCGIQFAWDHRGALAPIQRMGGVPLTFVRLNIPILSSWSMNEVRVGSGFIKSRGYPIETDGFRSRSVFDQSHIPNLVKTSHPPREFFEICIPRSVR